jgi:hypothetical protein
MQQDNLPVDDTNPRAVEEHRILDDGCALRLFCNRWTSMRYPTTRDVLAYSFRRVVHRRRDAGKSYGSECDAR